MNYPRVWQLLPRWGLNSEHTLAMGVTIIMTFFLGLLIMLWQASYKLSIVMLVGILSPATFLAIERANIDLFIFFLTSASISLLARHHIASFIVTLFAFSLKIFPLFSLIMLIRLETKRALLLFALCVFSTLYSFIYIDDLIQIRNGTPRSMNLSYGMNVFWMALSTFHAQAGSIFKYAIYFSTICWLIFCLAVLSNRTPTFVVIKSNEGESKYLDYFRAGAGIYCFTFLLGNNWGYRLIFLLFTLPQLLIWAKYEQAQLSKLAKLSIVSIFISHWYLIISGVTSNIFLYGENLAYLLDQLAKWFVFFSLSYLFSLSASDFFRRIMKSN